MCNPRHTPFALSDMDSPKAILERIGKGEFELSGRLWDGVSDKAKELIRTMLEVDPRIRITTQKILSHPWITKRETLNNSKLERKGKNSIKVCFFKFCYILLYYQFPFDPRH